MPFNSPAIIAFATSLGVYTYVYRYGPGYNSGDDLENLRNVFQSNLKESFIKFLLIMTVMEDILLRLPTIIEAQAARQDEQAEQVKLLTEAISFKVKVNDDAKFYRPEVPFESFANTIENFIFDPDNGSTFDAWFSRYEDVFTKDTKALNDAGRVRFLLYRLNALSENGIQISFCRVPHARSSLLKLLRHYRSSLECLNRSSVSGGNVTRLKNKAKRFCNVWFNNKPIVRRCQNQGNGH